MNKINTVGVYNFYINPIYNINSEKNEIELASSLARLVRNVYYFVAKIFKTSKVMHALIRSTNIIAAPVLLLSLQKCQQNIYSLFYSKKTISRIKLCLKIITSAGKCIESGASIIIGMVALRMLRCPNIEQISYFGGYLTSVSLITSIIDYNQKVRYNIRADLLPEKLKILSGIINIVAIAIFLTKNPIMDLAIMLYIIMSLIGLFNNYYKSGIKQNEKTFKPPSV